ncbi:S-adenosyl-L-methionine-dependent methyltransferase [Aspergillus caelatus]|uniref:phosphoethanolamine N-methyltransferase n=1 Tax=Aspergillus caelatus TaxID=61420 RepID=A0A5N7A7W0_9EURO|nr:S-adenosyl-L-methionine-dependent methyltransferase [Aspergillus caelatus]KAE8365912.1 S-adenosyl-L-methionine-dependent methyltransferase [Aspergillus caelatus]
MDTEAEMMFDDIAKTYEATFAHDPSLHQVIDQALDLLEPNSRVLDVGCGTGKPVSYRLAEAGHDVIGIDISQNMIDIASRQVKGAFTKVDMTKYQPATKFHCIFAIFSLFNISRSQIHSMVSKFFEWLEPGGRLVLATIPSDCLFQDRSMYDQSAEWVDQKPMYFMGHDFCGSAATTGGWKHLFSDVGFEIETEFSYQFSPPDIAAHKRDPDHHYFIIRRGMKP